MHTVIAQNCQTHQHKVPQVFIVPGSRLGASWVFETDESTLAVTFHSRRANVAAYRNTWSKSMSFKRG